MPADRMDYGPADILAELEAFIERAVQRRDGDRMPVKPSHRIPFHWPPHPVSVDFHILAHEFHGRATFEAYGESIEVLVARTPMGVFGKCEKYWNEARGDTEEEMLRSLREGSEPLFQRQFAIGRTLERCGRYTGSLRELAPVDLIKLLYCEDRDVAISAGIIIETHARSGLCTPALIRILRDDQHPHRRSAQWCALDMFEDLPSFSPDPSVQMQAIDAMKSLLWNATDDYARTMYKAGVVLGGHICTDPAADAILACVGAPSRIGRRSAIHAVFHLAEWMPARKGVILKTLARQLEVEPEPKLAEFIACMIRDIEAGNIEHATEPTFADEPQ